MLSRIRAADKRRSRETEKRKPAADKTINWYTYIYRFELVRAKCSSTSPSICKPATINTAIQLRCTNGYNVQPRELVARSRKCESETRLRSLVL